MFGFSSLRCSDCNWVDPKDRNRYGEYYCTKEREYVSPESYTCRSFVPNFYVMTAYCNIKKLPYDCDDMVKLIAFRDNYMMNNIDGRAFLEEYESIGPIIAMRLQCDIYRTDIVDRIKTEYIDPAIEMINSTEYKNAQETYIEMIESLKVRYGYAPVKNDKIKRL